VKLQRTKTVPQAQPKKQTDWRGKTNTSSSGGKEFYLRGRLPHGFHGLNVDIFDGYKTRALPLMEEHWTQLSATTLIIQAQETGDILRLGVRISYAVRMNQLSQVNKWQRAGQAVCGLKFRTCLTLALTNKRLH